MKGDYNAECNRTACSSRRAVWYNHSTRRGDARRYYCTACARQINEANERDAQRLYGHSLCTMGEHQTEQES